jgi:hypothetical protein
MSAHDDLARQLRESVRARRRRRRARRGLALTLAGAAVIGGGAATAATGVLPVIGHGGDRATARELAARAVRETTDQPVCRLDAGRGAAGTVRVPADQVAAPLLRGPADPAAQRLAAGLHSGRAIVAGGARRVPLPDGRALVAFLGIGLGPGAPADPEACLSARLAWLAANASGTRRAAAEAIVRGFRDTIKDMQWLNVFLTSGEQARGAGTGIPLDGRRLPTGVIFYGGGDYVGIAVPGARRVTVDGHALHRRFAVSGRFFLVTVPAAGTGPLRLRQRAADGRVLAGQTLRG